ncbi:MAG: GHKL domain-containing protein [Planctomycetes bacterium]|nr:GHKL domain-containing protein [Planctomycetota bacterium]
MIHTLYYLDLKTRNLARYIALCLLMVGGWYPVSAIQTAAPVLIPVVGVAYVVYAVCLFRLVTDDAFSRILLCGAFVLTFGLVLRIPPLLFLVYACKWPPADSVRTTACVSLILFGLISPLLIRYVRPRVVKVLFIAETQKWYLVGLMPVLLFTLGMMTNQLVMNVPDTPMILQISLLTPVCIIAYFVSIYLFLVNHHDKLILRQRLAAEQQMGSTYDFYDKVLSEKEARLRTLRHDFRHLALHLGTMAEAGDFEGLKSELRSVSTLDGGEADITPFCENHTINAVTSLHFAAAHEQGINCTANVFAPESLPIPKAELALIMGNALENAVKGASTLGQMGYVTFDARPVRGYLALIVSNNYDKRSYAKGEGSGLASIRQLCEKHQGVLEITDTGKEYTLRILLLLN